LILLNNINLEYVNLVSGDSKHNYSSNNIISNNNNKDLVRFFIKNEPNILEEFLLNENDMKNKLINLLEHLNQENMLFDLSMNDNDYMDAMDKENEFISENYEEKNINIKELNFEKDKDKDREKNNDNLNNEGDFIDCKKKIIYIKLI